MCIWVREKTKRAQLNVDEDKVELINLFNSFAIGDGDNTSVNCDYDDISITSSSSDIHLKKWENWCHSSSTIQNLYTEGAVSNLLCHMGYYEAVSLFKEGTSDRSII